jgi:hypothetical protein
MDIRVEDSSNILGQQRDFDFIIVYLDYLLLLLLLLFMFATMYSILSIFAFIDLAMI